MFLGMDVRVVNNEYIVLKDMFQALGRVRENGGWGMEKGKLITFLEDVNEIEGFKTFEVLEKQGKRKVMTTFECLKLDVVPMVLTQFKPTARKGEEALSIWRNFMVFVKDLLVSLEVYKFIITDKRHQMDYMEILTEAGGSPIPTNNFVNAIMAELIGVYPEIKRIKKEELRIYQDQTTIDLLEVREYVMEKFINAFEFTNSHKDAYSMALKLAKKKYQL